MTSSHPTASTTTAASPSRHKRTVSSAVARTMQPVPLSYTYGSPVIQSNSLDYEPPARTWARERAAGTRQRSRSAVASTTADTENNTEEGGHIADDGDVTNLAAHGPGAWNGGTSSPDKQQQRRSGQNKPASRDAPIKTVASQQMSRPKGSLPTSTSASVLQQRPDASSGNSNLKDTSVNIATAFRQAASTVGPAMASTNASTGNGGIGFLSRAGDRVVPVAAEHNDGESANGDDGMDEYDTSNQSLNALEGIKETAHAATTGNTASRKRKKPSGDRYKGSKDKDSAFKISKEELNEVESDSAEEEDDDDDESVDLEELRAEYGITSNISINGSQKKRSQAKQPKKKARVAEGSGEQAEDGGTEVASTKVAAPKKTGATSRKSGQKDGAYKPGQESDSEDYEDEYDIDEAGKRRKTTRKSINKGKSRAVRDDSTALSTAAASDHGDSASTSLELGSEEAQKSQMKQGMTSFYLHAPNSPSQEPEFQTQEQARLTQVHPKSGNNGSTYQPYFAFSTTTIGTGPGRRNTHVNTSATLSRARRESSVPTSQTGSTSLDPADGGHGGGVGNITRETGPSSNASFDQRGSEYDYAEEERMTAALLAARERDNQVGRRVVPEGRPNMLLGEMGNHYGGRDNREMSLPLSEQSSHDGQQQQQQVQPQRRLGPRRAPPPPGPSGLRRRSPSVLSETPDAHSQSGSVAPTSAQDEEARQATHPHGAADKRSIGRKLGEITRTVFLVCYWCTVGPVKALLHADWNKLWKWAAVITFIGLMLGSMNERADSSIPSRAQSSSLRYYLPFLSSPSSNSAKSTFDAPQTLPSNFDELISRLTNLETSFSTLSSTQVSDRSNVEEQVRTLSESARRLSLLEGEFESEKRRSGKTYDGLVKEGKKENQRMDIDLKGVKTQLDYLSERLKIIGSEKKQETTDLAKMRSELSGVNKDLDVLGKRMTSLSDQIQESHSGKMDEGEIAKIVAKRIEEILPSRMAVSLDSGTGEIKIDPKFWQYLKDTFPQQQQAGSGTVSAPKWEDFLAGNQASLRKMIEENVDDRLGKGAILSRKSFTEILERELMGLRNEMSEKTREELARLSTEVNGKIAKIPTTSSSGTTQKKHQSIKLSSGEDLNNIVNSLIGSALSKYSKDVLARPDFALYSSGGRVIPSLTSPTYEIRPSSSYSFTSLLARTMGMGVIRGKAPVTALHPDISVGQCWPFSGQTGQLGIMLSRKILPTEVTIEHASKEVALDVTSAPKSFEVWGLVEDREGLEKLASMARHDQETEGVNNEMVKKAAPPNRLLLVKGEYDVQAENNIQSFPVPQEIQNLEIPVHVVLFRILDNHGNEALSCLYRVRVGGSLVEEELVQ